MTVTSCMFVNGFNNGCTNNKHVTICVTTILNDINQCVVKDKILANVE